MARSSWNSGELAKRALSWVKRYHPWISLGIFGAAYGLYYIGKVVKTPEEVAACGILLLISILERLINIGTTVDEIATRQQAAHETLFSLQHCMTDLDTFIQTVKRSNTVVIEHLGLDMTDGWGPLRRVIASCPTREIDCRVLIMTDDPNELGPDAPVVFSTWCLSVGGTITRIRQDTESLGKKLAEEGKKLRFELRKYTGTPMIHGFKLQRPVERGYISFASRGATDATFEWGANDYFTFSSGTASSTDRRLRELFSGAFEHYWKHASKKLFDYSSPVPVNKETKAKA